MSEPFDVMSWAEEESQSDGGAGYVTTVVVEAGYLVFGKGLKEHNEDRFWRVTGGEDKDAQKALASEYAKANKGSRLTTAFLVKIIDKTVLNRDEPPVWQNGSWDNYLISWGQAYKDVFAPSFAEFAKTYEYGTPFWCRVELVEDPRQPKYTNSAGEEKSNLVPKIVEYYDSEDEAYAAATSGAVVQLPAMPEKYKEESAGPWDGYSKAIWEAAQEADSADELYIFESIKNGVTQALLNEFYELAQEQNQEEDFPF